MDLGGYSFRSLLNHVFEEQGHSFKQKHWAEIAHVSPTELNFYLKGKRYPSKQKLSKLLEHLDVGTQDKQLLYTALEAETAKSGYARAKAMAKLIPQKATLTHTLSTYLSDWVIHALHMFVDRVGMRVDPQELARSFLPRVRVERVRNALQHLVDLGLLEIENQRVTAVVHDIDTPDHVPGPIVTGYHDQMAQLATEALVSVGAEDRSFATVTARVPASRYAEVLALVQKLRKNLANELSLILDESSNRADTEDEQWILMHFNVQGFPLTQTRLAKGDLSSAVSTAED